MGEETVADGTSYEILTTALGLLTATHADSRVAGPALAIWRGGWGYGVWVSGLFLGGPPLTGG